MIHYKLPQPLLCRKMRREFFQNAAQHTRIIPEKVSVSTARYVEGV